MSLRLISDSSAEIRDRKWIGGASRIAKASKQSDHKDSKTTKFGFQVSNGKELRAKSLRLAAHDSAAMNSTMSTSVTPKRIGMKRKQRAVNVRGAIARGDTDRRFRLCSDSV